jgi:hypothetical protein
MPRRVPARLRPLRGARAPPAARFCARTAAPPRMQPPRAGCRFCGAPSKRFATRPAGRRGEPARHRSRWQTAQIHRIAVGDPPHKNAAFQSAHASHSTRETAVASCPGSGTGGGIVTLQSVPWEERPQIPFAAAVCDTIAWNRRLSMVASSRPPLPSQSPRTGRTHLPMSPHSWRARRPPAACGAH